MSSLMSLFPVHHIFHSSIKRQIIHLKPMKNAKSLSDPISVVYMQIYCDLQNVCPQGVYINAIHITGAFWVIHAGVRIHYLKKVIRLVGAFQKR